MSAETTDPRVLRTRRDVVDTTAALLLEAGWDGVTHAEIARRSGYSKATIYTHWPTRLDLIHGAIDQICDVADHPAPTGDLLDDLRAALHDFAADLTEGHLDRLLAGVIERAHTDSVVDYLRGRLYETGTAGLRAILREHMNATDLDPTLALLTGAILVRVAVQRAPATDEFIDEVIARALSDRQRNSFQ